MCWRRRRGDEGGVIHVHAYGFFFPLFNAIENEILFEDASHTSLVVKLTMNSRAIEQGRLI